MSRKLLMSFAVLSVLFLLSGLSSADLVKLKDGRVLRGKAKRVGNKLVIQGSHGSVEVPYSHVIDWQTQSPMEKEFAERLAKLAATDADGYYRLGNWAKKQALNVRAKECYEKAIKIDPNHLGSRASLGFVEYKGTWVQAEDMYRVQGLVKFKGQWMTPVQKAERARDLETIEELEKKLNKTRNDLRKTKFSLDIAKTEAKKLDRQNRKLVKANTVLTNNNRALTRQNQALTDSNRALQRENLNYESQLQTLTCQVQELQSSNSSLRRENNRLRKK